MKRYVTPNTHSPLYWLGRLSTALAVAPHQPTVAQDALKDYLRSPIPDPEEREIIQQLRRSPR